MTESDVQSSLRPVPISKKSDRIGMECVLSNEILQTIIASSRPLINDIFPIEVVQREALATKGEVIGGTRLVVYDDLLQFGAVGTPKYMLLSLQLTRNAVQWHLSIFLNHAI